MSYINIFPFLALSAFKDTQEARYAFLELISITDSGFFIPLLSFLLSVFTTLAFLAVYFFLHFFFYWRQTFDGLYPQKIFYFHDVLVVFGSLFSYCIYILHRYLAGYFFSLPFRLFFFNFSVVLWI